MDEATAQLVYRILRATAFDNCCDIWWRVDEEYAPITIFVGCNDVFWWGCADCEAVTAENIEILEQAYKDATYHGGALFCARVRGMRPQGAFYKHIESERALFDACGPERELSHTNPIAQ